MFDSIKQVINFYRKNKRSIKKIPFPIRLKDDILTVNKRGQDPFSVPLQNPTQISPDGKRYNIKGKQVTYMFWEFEVKMSPVSGPQLFDIRFQKERIAYEISLQELTSFYSGNKPVEYTANFFDGSLLLGMQSKYLVPEIDCPGDATFISTYFFNRNSNKTLYNAHAFCIFELNTGIPVRRHHGYYGTFQRFYEGMVSVVLTVRSILTAGNYDYIVDYIFYQTGAIEVKVSATGIIIGSFYNQPNPYGFQLYENLMGPIHHHLYNFKVDLDIEGTLNKFESLDIKQDIISTEFHRSNALKANKHFQVKFVKDLKSREKEAAFNFDFDKPKLLILSNNNSIDKFGNTRGYRIVNKGMSNNLRPSTEGFQPAMSWSQYQVAVTKYKDDEPKSSSIYAIFDSGAPVVNFQNFVEDDEDIVNQDLVAWVTMGAYHIPSKEDLPVTHTPGMEQSFYLLPYNYFDDNPAMSSSNAVRIDPVDVQGKTESVKVNRYGVGENSRCIPHKNYYEAAIQKNPCLVVECLKTT